MRANIPNTVRAKRAKTKRKIAFRAAKHERRQDESKGTHAPHAYSVEWRDGEWVATLAGGGEIRGADEATVRKQAADVAFAALMAR